MNWPVAPYIDGCMACFCSTCQAVDECIDCLLIAPRCPVYHFPVPLECASGLDAFTAFCMLSFSTPSCVPFRLCLSLLSDPVFRYRSFGGAQLATPTGWRPCTPTGPFRDTLFQQLTDAAANCKPDLAEQVTLSIYMTVCKG